jgi:hypothetical protein
MTGPERRNPSHDSKERGQHASSGRARPLELVPGSSYDTPQRLSEFEDLVLRWMRVGAPRTTVEKAQQVAYEFLTASDADLAEGIDYYSPILYAPYVRAIARVHSRLSDADSERVSALGKEVLAVLVAEFERRQAGQTLGLAPALDSTSGWVEAGAGEQHDPRQTTKQKGRQ